MHRAALLSLAVLTAGGLGFGSPVAAASPPAPAAAEPASVPDELLVGYDAGTSARDRAAARSRAGSRLVSVVVADAPGRGVVELVVTPAGSRGQAERRFESDPKVSYAEPNWVYSHAATSNDPSYTNGSLWGMYGDATSPANSYGSQAGEAWAAGNTGSDQVYVGVIDEGIQVQHPDLDANVWVNPFDKADGVDNDGNGYVDDVNGWDFAGNNSTVYDGTGDDHGTHVAGTIGAEGGNGTGVAGVAWNVTMISAKFLGSTGGSTSNAIKAIDYLTNLKTKHGLNVVATNNSWGGGGYSQGVYDAIQRANAANILFIAAAGNGGSDKVGDNNDVTPFYPASYSNTNVISVASITSSGSLSGFSNYGATTVDLGAPGSGIRSTLPDSTYGSYNGTSMATPHVTGAAVLYAHWKPGSTAAQIKAGLQGAVTPMSGLSVLWGGRLDAGGFATAASTDTTAPAAPTGVMVKDEATGGTLTVSWTPNTETDLHSYEVYRDGSTTPVHTAAAGTHSWTNTGLVNGTPYSYYVKALDRSGNRSPSSTTVSGTPSAPPASSALTLSATGYKVKGGLQQVDLTWSGGDVMKDVQISRSGTSSTTYSTANDGFHTDKPGKKGSGTYQYTVCQGGTCSGPVTVVF